MQLVQLKGGGGGGRADDDAETRDDARVKILGLPSRSHAKSIAQGWAEVFIVHSTWVHLQDIP